MMINDVKNIQANLGKNLKELTRILDTTLAQIPEEHMDEIGKVRADMQKVINSIKSGDSDVSSEIIKKYGNTH